MNSLKPVALKAALLLASWLSSNAWAAAAQARPAETTETASAISAGGKTDAQAWPETSVDANAKAKAEAEADANAAAYAKLPVCKLSQDGKRLMVEPCRTAPAAVPMPRRPVPLTIQRMPSNKVAPQVAMPQIAPSTPIETLMQPPGSPIPAVGCTAAGCYDPSGARHNSGPAGTTVTPTGKLCNRQGVWLQC